MQLDRGDSGSGLQSEINITPLVDVVLVLLIIFMVVVPLLMQGYDVDIPRTSAQAVPARAAESRLILPAKMLLPSKAPKKELDIVFYRAPKIEVAAPVVPLSPREKTGGASAPAPALNPKPNAALGPDAPGRPELPPGPTAAELQHQ